jgi:hypothetical protein
MTGTSVVRTPPHAESDVGRFATRVAVALLFSAAVLARAAPSEEPVPVDLDAPGALLRLEVKQPQAFATITSILREAGRVQDGQLATWLQSSYGATKVELGSYILSSSSGLQRRVSFVLNGAAYQAIVSVPLPAAASAAK